MPLFEDLLSGPDGVYSLTNRADLVAESKLALRQATLAAHRSDFYPKDRHTLQIAVADALSVWELDIPSSFPNWRSFAAIRPYDALTGSLSKIVLGRNEELAPDAILDEYREEHLNVWYTAGNNLNLRLESAFTGLLVVYYKNPVLTPEASYDSWIGTEWPHLITIDAARMVMGMIGYEEAANRLNTLLFGGSQKNWHSPDLGGIAADFKSNYLTGSGA